MIENLLLFGLSLPIVGAFLVIAFHKTTYRIKALLSTFISLITFFLFIIISAYISREGALSVSTSFMHELGVNVLLYVDSLSIFFALLISFFGSLSILYSIKDMASEEGATRYYALMLLFLGSMVWLVLAGNLLLLFVFFEYSIQFFTFFFSEAKI